MKKHNSACFIGWLTALIPDICAFLLLLAAQTIHTIHVCSRLGLAQWHQRSYSQTPSPLLNLAQESVFCLTHTKLPPQAHTANATTGINRCCQPLPYKSSSPFLCRVLALTSELLWGHTTVTVGGQSPGWRADAVVGPWGVHTLAVLTVGWVLTLVYIWKETEIHS